MMPRRIHPEGVEEERAEVAEDEEDEEDEEEEEGASRGFFLEGLLARALSRSINESRFRRFAALKHVRLIEEMDQ